MIQDNPNRRCDILFVIRSMGRGGAERQLSLLARGLHRDGYRVAVALFYAEGAFLAELTDAGVPVIDLQKGGRWSNFGVARRLLAYIAAARPLVVHPYLPVENVLTIILKPWIRRRGGAVACGIRIAKFDARSYGLAMHAVYAAQRLALRFADRVISNSADALEELHASIPEGRGVSVPNGVEVERFAHDPARRIVQRQAWSLDEQNVAIGIVGRLDRQKNHLLAISALPPLVEKNPAARLVIVGGGGTPDYEASLRRHADTLGVASHVIWAGPCDDMAGVYSALDILCLSSNSEGFPNVVAEAMSVGLPCIGSDVGDTALVIGDAGWIVPPGDIGALSTALGDALDRLSAWDPDVPRRRIEENFSVECLKERTLRALHPFLAT